MDYRYILIAVSVLASVSSSFGSQAVTTSSGKTATLQCPIANLDSDLQSLYWRKDGTTIYSLTSSGVHTIGNYLVTLTASLVIPDVTESDAGNYSCKVVRQSFATEESDVMQLYVIDVSVSHCKGTRQEVDGCSCSINGLNITSLECSASGFPHPPVITWEEDRIISRSSSVDLKSFSERIALTCKARDDNLKGAVANKTVCVYYAREVTSTDEPPDTASAIAHALLAAILIEVSTILIIVLLPLLKRCLAAAYRCKTGKAFHLPPFTWTSTPKPPGGNFGVLKDSWKNSKGSSVGYLPTPQPEITSIEDGIDDDDSPIKKDCNQEVVVDDELPLVGQVLLDDLRSAPEETKESIKGAVHALVEKRVEPYKFQQSHVDPAVTIHTSYMNATLQRSVKTEGLGDAAFVDMILQSLDRILVKRDRDECEILITKPDFHEVTDESQIPAYQGKGFINQSLPMQANMTSSMTMIMVGCNPLATTLREKLVKKPSERAAIRNAISQIILDFLETGHSGLTTNNKYNLNCSTAMLPGINASSYAHGVIDDEVFRLVAFWTSKIDKLDNEVNNRIKKYLFPLKLRTFNKSSDLHPVVKTRQEKDEIQDIPSTARLLEEKCGNSEYSNDYQSST